MNHFDNNLVFTSKYGLARNLRTLIYSDNIDCYEFFPRCFDLADLQEFEDFIENFKATKVIQDQGELRFICKRNDVFCFVLKRQKVSYISSGKC